MYPCSACHRHLRADDSTCPFCGTAQRAELSPRMAIVGAFALAAVTMLGTTACSSDTVPAGDGGVTTNMSESSSTGPDETESSGEVTSDATSDVTTVTDTNDTVDDNTDTSLSFYAGPDDDWGSAPDCDIFVQDCPDGEKCVPYASTGGNWDANKCVPILGDGQAGEPCTYDGVVEATDSCAAGLGCWNVLPVDDEAIGTCTPFCMGSIDDQICPQASDCVVANDGSIAYCIDTCDPTLQACPDGLGCFWADDAFVCIFKTQDIPGGEPCGYWNDCTPGLACIDGMALPSCQGTSCCTPYCDLGDPICPDPETECVSFFQEQMPPEGYEHIGVCLLPP